MSRPNPRPHGLRRDEPANVGEPLLVGWLQDPPPLVIGVVEGPRVIQSAAEIPPSKQVAGIPPLLDSCLERQGHIGVGLADLTRLAVFVTEYRQDVLGVSRLIQSGVMDIHWHRLSSRLF